MKELGRVLLTVLVCLGFTRLNAPPVPLEAQLQERCQRSLDAALGTGRAHVEVTVETGECKRDREESLPGPERVATGCQEKQEKYDGRYAEATSSTKYEVAQRHEVLHRTSQIQRINAAIVVRDVDPAELPALRQLASGALGLDPVRQDQLSLVTVSRGKVTSAPF